MRKRMMAFTMAAAMVAGLVGCGGGSSSSDSTAADGGATGSTIKVGLVTDTGGVNDGSFNQTSWAGLTQAKEELGIEVKYLESATDADYIPNIESFVDEEYDLIVCAGYQLADALRTEAEANPDVNFIILDDASVQADNVQNVLFEQSQASYLVGYIAGLTTETNTVGVVLGMATDTMNEFGIGYTAGVLDANPDATVLQANANSFADTAGGKTAANNMITDGADVIFQAAGGTGLGVIDGCKEAGIWAIGVDSDQSPIAPETILSSAMKRVDTACYDAAKAVLEGTFEAGIKTYSLADAGVDIAPTTDNIDAEVLTQIEEIKAQIVDGTIEVPKTIDAFNTKYGEGIYKLAE